jgi:hypothetical protein
MKYSDEDLQRLLARGRLGGPARERVLDRVLDKTAPARTRRRAWLVPLVLALGSGVALLVLVIRPRPDDVVVVRPRSDEDRWRNARWGIKGGATAAAVTLEARCAEGACRPGSTLLFSAFGAATPGYLEAYAEPAAGGGRIWYFSAETESPLVPASAQATQPAGRGIVIGPEHAPGTYQVHLFFCSAPLPQALLLQGTDPRILARAIVPVVITGR